MPPRPEIVFHEPSDRTKGVKPGQRIACTLSLGLPGEAPIPSFVAVFARTPRRRFSVGILDPRDRAVDRYTYSGSIKMPYPIGEYQLEAEVAYLVVEPGTPGSRGVRASRPVHYTGLGPHVAIAR